MGTVREPVRTGTAAQRDTRTVSARFSVRLRWTTEAWSVSRLYPGLACRTWQRAIQKALKLAAQEPALAFAREAGRPAVTIWRLKEKEAL